MRNRKMKKKILEREEEGNKLVYENKQDKKKHCE